jgi:hypothetical protein
MDTSAPQAASFEQLLGKLVLNLLRFAGRLVLEQHCQLGGRYLPMGQFAGPITYHRGQRASRYKQIDKVAAEGIGGAAQRV